MEILCNDIGWITITFSDGSKKIIQTTLRSDILQKYGVKQKIDYFYDLNRGEYYKFRYDAESISVQKDKPIFEELIEFVNRFI